MTTITSWIISILSVVLLSVIVDLILPDSNMSKYIKSTLASVTILVVIMPLPSLISSGFDWDEELFNSSQITLDEDFLDYTTSVKASYLEEGLLSQLQDDGVQNLTLDITCHSSDGEIIVDYVYINMDKIVLVSQDEHINSSEQVIALICSYLEIESWQVVIL